MTSKSLLNKISHSVVFTGLVKLTSIAKISFIGGSYSAFFSVALAIGPLAGAFMGISGSFLVFGIGALLRLLVTGSLPLHFLAYHIPGLFASLYWATRSPLIQIVPALIAMFLFVTHPVASGAALYSLFWLIPVGATLFYKDTLGARALGSTFTAHAVGSIIWLYTVPMSADQWLMLIPVVVVERLLCAVAMVVAYKVFCSIRARFHVRSKHMVFIQD